MGELVGTWSLARFIARRDRVRLIVWVAVLSLVPIGVANAFIGLYPTEAARQELVSSLGSAPALTAILGPIYGSSIGALTVWRIGAIVALLTGIMTVSTLIRHTREEEETGRRELLGSTVVGRHAPLSAALTVAILTGIALGSIAAAGLIGVGLPASGSLAFGLGLAAVATVFAGVGAIAAQLTEGAGAARGIGIGAVGLFFLFRVAGDGAEASGLGWLTWLSPIGWYTRLRSFADEEWGVLALFIGLAVVLGGIAFSVASRRDVAAGAFHPRPGPETASRLLGSEYGLAWRLQKGSLLAWTIGLVTFGGVFGSVADSIGEVFADNPQLADIFERLGGEQAITDAFFSAAVGIFALIAAAYAIRAVLRLKVEEDDLRAEPVLATATTRTGFTLSHLLFGIAGPAVMLVLAAMTMGAIYGAISGDIAGELGSAVGAALVQLPAVWILTGVALALYGLAPRLVAVSWGFLVAFLLLGQLGQILQLPQWALNLSPFSHIPLVPVEEVEALPIILLLALAAALVATGLTAFRHRDMT